MHPKDVDPTTDGPSRITTDTAVTRSKAFDALEIDAVSVGEDVDPLPHMRHMPSSVSDTSSWLALEATRKIEISNLADAIKGCAACTDFNMMRCNSPQLPLPMDGKPDFLSITCMTPPSQAPLSAPLSHTHSKQLDVSALTGPRSTFMRHFVKPSSPGTRRNSTWGERRSYPLDLLSLPTTYTQITRACAVSSFEKLCKMAFFLCCLYDAWIVSCWLAFAPRDGALPDWCKVMRLVPACLYTMDLVFHFFADVLLSEQWGYLRTYFLADLVATASDITLLVWAGSPSLLMATKLLRAFRLWGFHVHAHWAYTYLYLVAKPKFVPQLTILQLMLLVIAHVLAVAWGLLLRDEDYDHLPSNGSLAEACHLYLDTFRLACGSLTFGGDMPSFNQGQRMLGVICAAVRLLLLALGGVWVVWQGVIQSIKDAEATVQQEGLLNYLQRRHIPIKLRFQAFSVMEEAMRVQRLQQQCHGTTAWRTLFGPLSDTISQELWMSRLTTLGIIREIVYQHPALGVALAHRVHEEALPANVRLYCAGEISFAAFLVLNGVLHVQSDNDQDCEPPALDFTAGMWVGEQALVNPELLCIETVMSVTRVELMVVPAQEFHECLRKFDMAEAYRDLITQKLWRGLCGRCGAFGQHFSNKCPKLKAHRRAPKEFLRGLFSQQSSVQVAPAQQEISEGLRNFIIDNHIERLLVPMQQCGITNFGDISNHSTEMLDSMIALSQREACILADAAAKKFQDVRSVLTQSGRENHLVFISHYKVEAGTEATLMQTGFETMIQEYLHTIGLEFSRPVFTDTEDLRDLNKLKEHVRKSHNLILLLTKSVLSRPWCLVEIVTAVHAGTRVVPVEIKRAGMDFEYPDEAYYQRMLNREELDESAYNLLIGEGFDIADIVRCIQQVFKRIALPFSPHRTLNIREAEMWDILKQCRLHREESPNDSDSLRLFPTTASTPRTAEAFSRLHTEDASAMIFPHGRSHEELV